MTVDIRNLSDWFDNIVEIRATIQNFSFPNFINENEEFHIKTGFIHPVRYCPSSAMIFPLDLSISKEEIETKKLTVLHDIIVHNERVGEQRYVDHAYYTEWLEWCGFAIGDKIKIYVIIKNYYYKDRNGNISGYNYCFTGYGLAKRLNSEEEILYRNDVVACKGQYGSKGSIFSRP